MRSTTTKLITAPSIPAAYGSLPDISQNDIRSETKNLVELLDQLERALVAQDIGLLKQLSDQLAFGTADPVVPDSFSFGRRILYLIGLSDREIPLFTRLSLPVFNYAELSTIDHDPLLRARWEQLATAYLSFLEKNISALIPRLKIEYARWRERAKLYYNFEGRREEVVVFHSRISDPDLHELSPRKSEIYRYLQDIRDYFSRFLAETERLIGTIHEIDPYQAPAREMIAVLVHGCSVIDTFRSLKYPKTR